MESNFKQVFKRDGRLVAFERQLIAGAVSRAMTACGEGDPVQDAERVADAVVAALSKRYPLSHIPQVEEIQDLVEESLILLEFAKTAKAYILYRHERARLREKARQVPDRVRQLTIESKEYFPDLLSEFIYYRTYSRWIEEESRRETWVETVDRYMGFMTEKLGDRLTEAEYEELRNAILNQKIMPSMRLLWSAGKAARGNNIAAYNCSYVAPTRLDDLADIMYLLMSGVGVGFSVESQHVQMLPIVERQRGETIGVHQVGDSKEGWAEALKAGLHAWYGGRDIAFDFSLVRPAGARLKTMGGRSSGPAPLRALLVYARSKILASQGRRLHNIDLHDIICRIGDVVERGGVRRAALISLSDFDDEEMRRAKSGHFYIAEPQRAMANNSAVFNSKPKAVEFLREWLEVARGGTGERGIFNRGGLAEQMPTRRWPTFSDHFFSSGINPCGEIILRSRQFCNLTEVVAREDDTEQSLLHKIRIATILGTYQAMLTDFPYIAPEWKRNCEEERLLGVSITGQWDCPAVRKESVLSHLRQQAIDCNRQFAERFGINPATAVTCVKPSGTVSQLVNASSGMHPRYAAYYIRRIRISANDPLFAMLRDQKFPFYPETGQEQSTAATFVLEFPVRSPLGCVTRDDLRALEQLSHWKTVKRHFTEHNPSVTVSVGEEEWVEVADWLYGSWDIVGGLSFLPRHESVYELAPYEKIDVEEYERRLKGLPALDFSRIVLYEKQDATLGAKEYACMGGVCEIDPEEGSISGSHPLRS